jgi:hypothetical protein
VHSPELADAEKNPGRQGEHNESPDNEKVPGSHEVHVFLDFAPSNDDADPAGHGVHAS